MRALMPWRPFRELTTLHKDFDDLLGRFFGDEEGMPTRWPEMTLPKIESFRRDDELVVRADLPGVDPKKVELAIERDHLVIRGEREAKEERKEKDYHYREVSYGRFERVIELPAGVDAESVKATYHDGVLEVTMKAPKDAAPKKVPITVH